MYRIFEKWFGVFGFFVVSVRKRGGVDQHFNCRDDLLDTVVKIGVHRNNTSDLKTEKFNRRTNIQLRDRFIHEQIVVVLMVFAQSDRLFLHCQSVFVEEKDM